MPSMPQGTNHEDTNDVSVDTACAEAEKDEITVCDVCKFELATFQCLDCQRHFCTKCSHCPNLFKSHTFTTINEPTSRQHSCETDDLRLTNNALTLIHG